jgi:hypothetical protein
MKLKCYENYYYLQCLVKSHNKKSCLKAAEGYRREAQLEGICYLVEVCSGNINLPVNDIKIEEDSESTLCIFNQGKRNQKPAPGNTGTGL